MARNRGSLLGLDRMGRLPRPPEGMGHSQSTGDLSFKKQTGSLGARSAESIALQKSMMSGSKSLVFSKPGTTSAAIERSARLHAKSLVALRHDEHSRLNPPLRRSNAQKARSADLPPMWDRATLSSTVQPTAYPCDPRDEKTWMGTTGYPLVYPGDHRHEWTAVEYHGRDYPRRPWKLTHTRCLAAEEFKGRSNLAADSFDMMRPQQTTAEVCPKAPRWKTTAMGDKLTLEGCEEVKQKADSSAWETMRPRQDRPPPWAHVECPRARFVTASVMPASPWQ